MRTLVFIVFFAISSSYAFSQLRSGKPYSLKQLPADSLMEDLNFLPKTFTNLVADPSETKREPPYQKVLKDTGWLLKNVFLKSRYDLFNSYPPYSMAQFDTRSVSEYNALYRNYSVYFKR